MAEKMEMSLDEIIRSSKDSTRRPGNRVRNGRVHKPNNRPPANNGDINDTWKHDMFEDSGARNENRLISSNVGPTKLLVSNLDFGVSDLDMRELFSEFGMLKSATVHYDKSGRSLGTAEIVFERKENAIKAMKQYNGVPLDGRAMNIHMTTSSVNASPIASRIDFGNRRRTRDNDGFRQDRRRFEGNRNRNRNGGRRSGGERRSPVPTAEQLDAELDEYVKQIK